MAASSRQNNIASYAIPTLQKCMQCSQGQLEKVHVSDREGDVRILSWVGGLL
jgi:hypothetical protein